MWSPSSHVCDSCRTDRASCKPSISRRATTPAASAAPRRPTNLSTIHPPSQHSRQRLSVVIINPPRAYTCPSRVARFASAFVTNQGGIGNEADHTTRHAQEVGTLEHGDALRVSVRQDGA